MHQKKPTLKNSLIYNQLKLNMAVAMFGCFADFSGPIISNIVLGGAFKESGLVVGGVIGPINLVCMFFATLICGSASFLRNKYLSEGNTDKADRIFGTTCLVTFGFAVLVSVAVFLFRLKYLRLFSLSHVSIAYSYSYLGVYALTPFFSIGSYFFYECMFKDGANKLCSLLVGIQLATMIIGVSILPRFYQIKGVALANVFMEMSSFILGLVYVLKNRSRFRIKIGLKLSEIGEILKLGIMYCQSTLYVMFYSSITLIYVSRNFGESCMAVVVILETITDFISVFCGVPYASDNHLAIYLGEKNPVSIQKLIKSALSLQIIMSMVATIIGIVFARNIVLSVGINPSYIEDAIFAVRIYAASFVFLAIIQYNLDFFSFCEKTFASLSLAFTQYVIFGLGVSIVLSMVLGERGIYIGRAVSGPGSLIVAYIASSIRYKTWNPYLMDFADPRILSYDLIVNKKEIQENADTIEKDLQARDINQSTINSILLSFEESLMLTLEQSKKTTHCECVVFLSDTEIKMILRDDARIINNADPDAKLSSLRSYVVSRMSTVYRNHSYIDAAGSNRNEFVFKI